MTNHIQEEKECNCGELKNTGITMKDCPIHGNVNGKYPVHSPHQLRESEKVEICTAHGLPNCCRKFPNEGSWEERFGEKFNYKKRAEQGLPMLIEPKEVKSFIKETLATQRKEIGEKVEGMKFERLEDYGDGKFGWNNALDNVLSLLDKQTK